MLDPEYYETAPDRLTELIREAENWTITEIAARIADIGTLAATDNYLWERLEATNIFERDFAAEIAQLTKKGVKEIGAMFERAANAEHADRLTEYKQEGRAFTPYKDNKYLQQLTRAYAQISQGTFKNLTRTLGFTTREGEFIKPRDYFVKTVESAAFQTTAGFEGYNQAIQKAVVELSNSGLKTVEYPRAAPRSVVGVVRSNVLNGMFQVADAVEWHNIEQLGYDLIQVSAHSDSRPSHLPWQGKIFSLGGTVKEVLEKAERIREESKSGAALKKAEANTAKMPLTNESAGDNISTVGDTMELKPSDRHYKLWVNLTKQSDASLLKSIRSYRQTIDEHKQKVSSPREHVVNWDSKNDMYHKGIVRKWEKDIARNNEQLALALQEARKRRLNL